MQSHRCLDLNTDFLKGRNAVKKELDITGRVQVVRDKELDWKGCLLFKGHSENVEQKLLVESMGKKHT